MQAKHEDTCSRKTFKANNIFSQQTLVARLFFISTCQKARNGLSTLSLGVSLAGDIGRPTTMGVVTSDGMFWKQQLLHQLPRLEAGISAVGSSQPLLLLVFSSSTSWAAPAWFTYQSDQKLISFCSTSKERSHSSV